MTPFWPIKKGQRQQALGAHALKMARTGAPGGAQSVKPPTSAQVTISRFVGSSPASGSVLTARSLEPASDSVPLSLSLSLFLKTNKH